MGPSAGDSGARGPRGLAAQAQAGTRLGVGLALLRRTRRAGERGRPAPDADVERLDEDAEAHREVDVPLRDVDVEAVGDERRADQEQEAQGEDLEAREGVDEPPIGSDSERASRPRR